MPELNGGLENVRGVESLLAVSSSSGKDINVDNHFENINTISRCLRQVGDRYGED